MKFCMVTTFFGAHSFGGDAAYVDRPARALLPARARGPRLPLRRRLQRRPRAATRSARTRRPPGLHVHPLESRLGVLSPLATQVDGPAALQGRGPAAGCSTRSTPTSSTSTTSRSSAGPGVLDLGRRAVRLMTGARALADLPDAPALEVRPQGRATAPTASAAASPAAGRRRPGGYTGAIDRGLAQLDALIFPTPARPGGAPPPRASAPRWSTCPTSCPTTGRAGSRTRSPSRPPAGPTSPRPAGWWR